MCCNAKSNVKWKTFDIGNSNKFHFQRSLIVSLPCHMPLTSLLSEAKDFFFFLINSNPPTETRINHFVNKLIYNIKHLLHYRRISKIPFTIHTLAQTLEQQLMNLSLSPLRRWDARHKNRQEATHHNLNGLTCNFPICVCFLFSVLFLWTLWFSANWNFMKRGKRGTKCEYKMKLKKK